MQDRAEDNGGRENSARFRLCTTEGFGRGADAVVETGRRTDDAHELAHKPRRYRQWGRLPAPEVDKYTAGLVRYGILSEGERRTRSAEMD
ncbi:hypothetical protein GCM10020295_80770 [Streptomyces cinereospinus]